jgi:hypothetical protein
MGDYWDQEEEKNTYLMPHPIYDEEDKGLSNPGDNVMRRGE